MKRERTARARRPEDRLSIPPDISDVYGYRLAILALGIGAGTAIFSVVDAVVLRGLPFDEHDRLAVVLEHDTKRPTTFGGGTTTPQMCLDWRNMQESFEALAAVGGAGFRLRNEAGEPADARAQAVSAEFFPVLRVSPILGRTLTKDDEIRERHRVAILSYGFWQRHFGGDPGVVGKTIELNEEPWEIVGVLPRDFSYPVGSNRPAEIFSPIAFRDEDKVRGGSRNYGWTAVGRLKPGVSLEQAHEQMNRLMAATVFVAALATLAFSGLMASAVPARRAATVDPLVALRHE